MLVREVFTVPSCSLLQNKINFIGCKKADEQGRRWVTNLVGNSMPKNFGHLSVNLLVLNLC